jgi:hypothetical protein
VRAAAQRCAPACAPRPRAHPAPPPSKPCPPPSPPPPPPTRGNWLPEEEFHLALCHTLVGNQWSQHCNRLRGRTENSIKN